MPEPRVVQVAVPRPLHAVYDYALPSHLSPPQPGTRVRVPFGRSSVIGICVGSQPQSTQHTLKEIEALLDDTPLVGAELLDIAQWMENYYHYPLGEVLATILPAAARKGAAGQIKNSDHWQTIAPFDNPRAKAQSALHEYLAQEGPTSGPDLLAAGFKRTALRQLSERGVVARCEPAEQAPTEAALQPSEAQREAIASISASQGQFTAFVLEGVTGSGKTEVYLQAMAPVIARNAQVLVLVPEIALTPQTLRRFQARFAKVGMLHSNLTDDQRLQTWLKSAKNKLQVIIGTRSAVFTPFADLGLIIVDEEHDSSYKQQEGLRYSARDLATKRAHTWQIPVVLGSATPSLESLHNVNAGRYQRLLLPHRAGGASMPSYHVIDMRGQNQSDGLSVPLEHVMRRHLEANGQILVFLNRRGFAPTLLCAACGWQAQCPDCDAKLTLHRTPAQLVCHHCSLRFNVPKHCEGCGQTSLMPIGMGTQRTEARLQQLFPDTPVLRVDRDATRSNTALEKVFSRINQGDPCIMVGTQMLAKGHHFPNVTLVAIQNADAGFLSPDFRAPERTAQLIVQVAGRAGRAQRPGEVWIQSYQPENPNLVRLIEAGYPGFAELELAARTRAGFPPSRPMAMLRSESANAEEALALLHELNTQLRALPAAAQATQMLVLGPVPAPLARLANRSRFQLMLIAPDRKLLHRALDQLRIPKLPRDLRWSIDVDPYDSL